MFDLFLISLISEVMIVSFKNTKAAKVQTIHTSMIQDVEKKQFVDCDTRPPGGPAGTLKCSSVLVVQGFTAQRFGTFPKFDRFYFLKASLRRIVFLQYFIHCCRISRLN